MQERRPTIDGVKLAIMHKRFEGVTRKMANTLLRTARSGVINTARDFSCAIVTAECELLTAVESYPIHVLGGADLMTRAMLDIHPDVKPGDAFLHNSPYHGNTHAADHTILIPVFDDRGAHRFTVLAKAHQADCGNSLPTTYMGTARDVYQEGALIFPAVRVQEDYSDNSDIINMCMMRIRVPNQWRGDYLAMVGAARIGEREIVRMGEELGWNAVGGHAGQWFDFSERRMIETIAAMRSGRARMTCTHDPLPHGPRAGIAANAVVTVDSAASRIVVDLTDNIDCLPVGVNLSEACARTAAMVGVFNSLPQSVPANAGSFRRVEIRLRENCIVGIPRHPTSTPRSAWPKAAPASRRPPASSPVAIPGMAARSSSTRSSSPPAVAREPSAMTVGSRCSPWAMRECRSMTASRSTSSIIPYASRRAASSRTARGPEPIAERPEF